MTDNITIDNGGLADFDTSTDYAASGHIQRVKLTYSADGSDTHVPADADGLLVNTGATLTTTGGTLEGFGVALIDSAGDQVDFHSPGELTATPTIYSAGAIAQYDSLHTTIMTFAAAASANGGTGRILGARLVCKHDTFAGTIVLHLFRKSVTGTTGGDTLAVSDTDKLECFGSLTFDFSSAAPMGGGSVVTADRAVLPLDYKCDAGTDDIYGILQTTGTDTDTFGSGDLVPFLSYIPD